MNAVTSYNRDTSSYNLRFFIKSHLFYLNIQVPHDKWDDKNPHNKLRDQRIQWGN
jgi:hypothetical protein